MANLFDFKVETLKQEIEILNQRVNHFDHLRYQTKQMAITLMVAALGLGVVAKSPPVLILAALVPFPFWFLESVYHAYQEGFHARLRAVRDFIRDDEYVVQYTNPKTTVKIKSCFIAGDFGAFPVPDFYGIKTFDPEERKKNTSVWQNFKKTRMVVFYLPLVATAFILAILVYADVLKHVPILGTP